MPLRLALAATLGFLTFLSSLMLGMGQGDASLPVLMMMAAVVSFYLTDHRRVIQLGDWTVNILVILIFAFNVVEVLHYRGEHLAWAIARVLVFVQIVLFFREKNTRFGWQILLISLLQVVVATVFHQSFLFAMLLLLYVFVGLCAFILLFLQQEHHYFRQHSFVRTLSETIKKEMAERQDRRKLFRIVLMTILMGPLSLVLSFGKKTEKKITDQKTRNQEILRQLFLIFPKEEDLTQKERWESVDENRTAENLSAASFHTVPGRSGGTDSALACRRFPLLTERPSFSAGTQNPRPWSGNWRELFFHLTIGTLFASILAIIIFCLVPRVGQVDAFGFTVKQEFQQWTHSVRQQINVGIVGINDEIQLGSLGAVIPHHREVISVQFFHNPDNTLVTETDALTNPYRAITGATLYFRGTPLDTYFEGVWSQTPVTVPPESNETIRHSAPLRTGTTLHSQNQHQVFFESGSDLVTLLMTIQPLGTRVFFAPHPFFSINRPNEIGLRHTNGKIEEAHRRQQEATKTIATAVFQRGVQLDLVPNQEWVNRDSLLQIPDDGLDALKALAARWDAESRLPASDVIGRARFMEQKFLHSPDFAYQLGGTIRDYYLDPLEDFIAHNPRGHCEYFAGALALMLRSVGIGSRVILGFKTEVLDGSAPCIIRQSDAHAWVEVYIPPEGMPQRSYDQYAHWWQNGGWLRLDPTPPSDGAAMLSLLSLRWTDLIHSVQVFWDEYVLDMTSGKQSYRIYAPLQQAVHFIVYRVFNWEFWREFGNDMMWYYRSFFSDAPQQERQMWDGFYLMPPFIILGLLGLAGWRLTSMLLSTRKRAAEELRRRITIEFYLRMERMLAKIGIIREASATPLEFARQSSYMPLMLPIVEAFYRVRFGNVVLSEGESQTILKTLEQLEQSI